MNNQLRGPLFIFALSFFTLWLSAWIGTFFRRRQPAFHEDVYKDLDVIVAATLTMLALIIGFSFSMAISRYDGRKSCEETEANTIGSEYVRVDLLSAADSAKVRALLKDYLDQRI